MGWHRFDADRDPDTTLHFDADPDPDSTPSFVVKSDLFLLLFTTLSVYIVLSFSSVLWVS